MPTDVRRTGHALVLLADRDEASGPVYARVFPPPGYLVETADTGPEVLAKAISELPDVIIVNAMLPLIDGCTLCELLRNDPATRAVPVVVVTDDGQAKERAARAGATAVLSRATLEERLKDAIRTARSECATPAAASSMAASRRTRHHEGRALVPPPMMLRCPRCDATLTYERSFLGGVRKLAEQWDEFTCPSGCGRLEFRHRTRSLRRAQHSWADRSAAAE